MAWQVLGALDARGLVDYDAQGFARAIQAVGQQAGMGPRARAGKIRRDGLVGP